MDKRSSIILVGLIVLGMTLQAISSEKGTEFSKARSHQITVSVPNAEEVRAPNQDITLHLQGIAGPAVMGQSAELSPGTTEGTFYVVLGDSEERDIALKVDAVLGNGKLSGYSVVSVKNDRANVSTTIELSQGPQAMMPGPLYLSQVNSKPARVQTENLK